MSTPASSSPFDPFLPRVPPQDASALRQALYNVSCLVVVSLLISISYVVLMVVLQPFLLPMLWALLSGFVLHPYKTWMVSKVRLGIEETRQQTQLPMILVLLRVIGSHLGSLIDHYTLTLLGNWKSLAMGGVIITLVYYFDLHALCNASLEMLDAILDSWIRLEEIMGLNVLTLFLLMTLVMMLYYGHQRVGLADHLKSRLLLLLVHCLWFVGLSLCLGSLMALISVGVGVILTRVSVSVSSSTAIPKATPTISLTTPNTVLRSGRSKVFSSVRSSRVLPRSSLFTSSNSMSRATHYNSRLIWLKRGCALDASATSSDFFIRWLVCLCVGLQFYLHPSLLRLCSLPFLLLLLRAVWMSELFSRLKEPMQSKLSCLFESLTIKLSSLSRILVPPLVKELLSVYVRLEQWVLSKLNLDTLATISLLLFVLVSLLLSVVIVGVQVYAECVQSAQLGGKLVVELTNTSLYRELNAYLATTNSSMDIDSLLESAYQSGRVYISSGIKSLAMGNVENLNDTAAFELESKVLELWDRSYQFWLQRQQDVSESDSIMGPMVTQEAVSDSFEALVNLHLFSLLDVGEMGRFLRDNMGTLISVTDQFWALLKGNLVLVFSMLFEIINVILSSGSGVVNFGLSTLVFVTALYYLLANSTDTYLPVNQLAKYGLLLGINMEMGLSLNRAVNAVFLLTFKMAAFYAMLTYFTHTVFEVTLIVLPVLTAAFLAVIPVVGHYVVALPAILELWLAKNNVMAAVLLAVLHVTPTLVVDAAIYSGSGVHPWVTGLAVVGGIYYFGIAGAIYGPLMLCGLVVATAMSSGIVTDQMPDDHVSEHRQRDARATLFQRRESIG